MILPRPLAVFLYVGLWGFTLNVVTSLPLTIITSGKPYCRTLEAAKDAEIRVIYEAPGKCTTIKNSMTQTEGSQSLVFPFHFGTGHASPFSYISIFVVVSLSWRWLES